MWHPKLTKRKYQYNSVEHKREYASWYSMKQRCYNPSKDNFYHYGGRGITVCDRWLDSFDNFVDDMGLRPIGCTLDRIDGNGNYEPSNCRWATGREQNINSTFAHMIDDGGELICLDEFAKRYQISQTTVAYRLKKKISLDDLRKPAMEKHQVEVLFRGVSYTIRGLRREFPFAQNTFRRRLKKGVEPEIALAEVFNKIGIECVPSDFKYTEYDFEYKSLKV